MKFNSFVDCLKSSSKKAANEFHISFNGKGEKKTVQINFQRCIWFNFMLFDCEYFSNLVSIIEYVWGAYSITSYRNKRDIMQRSFYLLHFCSIGTQLANWNQRMEIEPTQSDHFFFFLTLRIGFISREFLSTLPIVCE